MSRKKLHLVKLTAQERRELEHFISRGKKSAREINRARILLLADEGKKDREISEQLGLSTQTIVNLRKRFSQSKYEHILEVIKDNPRSGRPIKIDSRVEAKISMIACSDPPKGSAQWTLRMIADRMVKLEFIDCISHESVRNVLKKRD